MSRIDKFVIARPLQQRGLSTKIPLGEIPAEIVNEYQSEQKVNCAFCSALTPHNIGFTAKMPDGRIALCGNCCAKRLFGSELNTLRKNFRRKRDRHTRLDGLIEFRRKWIEIGDALKGLEHAEAQLDRFVSLLRSANIQMPRESHINDSGDLVVFDEVEQSVVKTDRFGSERIVKEYQKVVKFRVRGFRAIESKAGQVQSIRSMGVLIPPKREIANLSEARLKNCDLKRERARDCIKFLKAKVSDFERLVDPTSISKLIELFRHSGYECSVRNDSASICLRSPKMRKPCQVPIPQIADVNKLSKIVRDIEV